MGAGVNIVLARRLGPQPIGIYALAIALSDVAALFVSWGVDTYLVQSPEDDREQFGTALTFVLLLGGVFLVLTALLIPFFLWRGQPLVAVLLGGLAIQRLLLLNGSCYNALLQRRFQFGLMALIRISTGMLEHAVAVAIAVAGGGVWALLSRDLLDAAGNLIGTRLVSKRPYRLQWRRPVAAKIRRFGVAILLAQTGELAMHRLDSALLGLTWGTRELAFYEEAFKLANVSERISQPALSQVALPGYARMREDVAARSAAFRAIQSAGLIGLAPFCLTLLLLPEPLIRLLFGQQWLGAVPMVRAFAGYALLLPLFEHLQQVLLSQGAAGAVARAKLVQLATFLPVLAVLLARWGGEGTAVAVDAGVLGALIVAALAARRHLTTATSFLQAYGVPMLAAILAVSVVAATRSHVQGSGAIALLMATYGLTLAIGYQGRVRRWWLAHAGPKERA